MALVPYRENLANSALIGRPRRGANRKEGVIGIAEKKDLQNYSLCPSTSPPPKKQQLPCLRHALFILGDTENLALVIQVVLVQEVQA